MSVVELRVELPSYSHSFLIQVPTSYTILEVKGEISKSCTGAPRADGQRLIWKGRVLRDEEKVEDVWKSTEDSRTIHLAVNPSAWSSSPPELPPPVLPFVLQPMQLHSLPQPMQPMQRPPPPQQTTPPLPVFPPPAPTSPHAMGYVIWKHQNAMHALNAGRVVVYRPGDPTSVVLETSRPWAVQTLEKNGYSWPAILDEPYPGVDDDGVPLESLPEGVKYEPLVGDNGQNFLYLRREGTPNIMQVHALKVLTYTFPLLSLPVPQSSSSTAIPISPGNLTIPREVNQLLQQLGLPPLRIPNQNQNRIMFLRDIPLRPLIAPFLMLIIRTLLLVYFVSPVRKPIFGLVIGAWILYEAWGPIRAVINGGADRHMAPGMAAHVPRPQEDGLAGRPGLGQNGAPQPQPQGQGMVPRAPERVTRDANQAGVLFDSLANINIPAETAALAASERARPTEEPGMMHKITTFMSLLVLTLHPAIWNRRRMILRQREGRIRTEADAMERQPEGSEADAGDEGENTNVDEGMAERERVARVRAELAAQHTRRPRWVQGYVDRVRRGEWSDE